MLENFQSLCKEKQKIIVSRENRVEHRANNRNENIVRHYQVDGAVIDDLTREKCDYLLLNDDKLDAYFIELKGTDFKHVIEQLESTELLLKKDLEGYNKNFRIVYRGNTHAIQSSDYAKFVLKWKGKVKAKTDKLEENIS